MAGFGLILAVTAVLITCVQSNPHTLPAATSFASYDLAVSGWSPAPTKAPGPEELRRRQASGNLCGYISGLSCEYHHSK